MLLRENINKNLELTFFFQQIIQIDQITLKERKNVHSESRRKKTLAFIGIVIIHQRTFTNIDFHFML